MHYETVAVNRGASVELRTSSETRPADFSYKQTPPTSRKADRGRCKLAC